MAYEESQNNYESPSDAPKTWNLGLRPIGYVVLMKAGGMAWEPTALTKDDDERLLLVRTCFTMFPTEADAEAELRQLQGRPFAGTFEARICAVFPAGMAAPHAKS